MKNELPMCMCGRQLVHWAGGYIGGDLSQLNIGCNSCGLGGSEIGIAGIRIVVQHQGGAQQDAVDWLNGVFLKRIAATEQHETRDIRHDSEKMRERPDVEICAVPNGVVVQLQTRNGSWKRFDAINTRDKAIPPDPQRAEQMKLWDERFSALEKELGIAIPRIETRNQYYDDGSGSDPWYAFELFGVPITTGWRKRVIAIKWTEDRKTPRLTEMTSADRVTHFNCEAHAWNTEKWLHYMTALALDLREFTP